MTRPLTSSQARAELVDLAAGWRLRAEQLAETEPTAAEEVAAAHLGLCALLRRWDSARDAETR